MRVQSGGQLPIPSAGTDPNRNRPVSAGWQPQAPGSYRQPSPGPRSQDLRPPGADYNQRPHSSQYDRPVGGLPAQPGPNRLAKMAPNAGSGRGGPLPPSGYGKRESSLPSPHAPVSRISAGGSPAGLPPMSGGPGPGPRVGPAPVGLPQGGPRPGNGVRPSSGVPLKDRPVAMDHGGRSSAPPPAQAHPSPAPSPAASTTSAPAKPTKTGPATFEQMGIPQGKQDDDCVSFFSLSPCVFSEPVSANIVMIGRYVIYKG
jgi:hypothetical protein